MLRLLATLFLGILSGCSWNTYANGKYGDILKTNVPRDRIVAALGAPAKTEHISDGPYYRKKAHGDVQLRVDRYYTKERIADIHKGSGTAMLAGMTLGVSELFYAPYALLDHYTPRTRELEMIYETDDTLRNYRLSNNNP